MVPGVNEVIARRLAGRIGAAGVVGGALRKAARGPKGAEHLIGADVMKPEAGLPFGRQALPVTSHRL